MKILLLSCCAPCCCAVIEKMAREGYDFAVAFYNPNIVPAAGYEKRREENRRLCEGRKIPFIELEYDNERWRNLIKGLENEPERGRRCDVCFYMRLKRVMEYARENGFDAVASVLGVSRYKDLAQVNRAAQKASQWVQENPDETAKIIVDKQYVSGDVDFCAQILKTYNYKPSVQGGYDALKLNAEELSKIGVLKEGTDAQKFADNAYIFFDDVPDAPEASSGTMTFGDLTIDTASHTVRVAGEDVALTPKEFDLLVFLASNKGIALSREKILQKVWNYDYFGEDRTVDTHVKMLRGHLGKCRSYIATVWGIGYKFDPDAVR